MADPTETALAPVCRFGPDRRLAALGAVLAAVAVAAVILSHDPAGRLLAGLAAVVLAAYVATDLLFWPRLVASGDGLRVHTPAAKTRLAWSEIDEIRVDERTHLGLMSRTLEIDAGSLLLVFSRRSLGDDPRNVLGVLNAFDPRRARGSS
jgi:hypothetical protein